MSTSAIRSLLSLVIVLEAVCGPVRADGDAALDVRRQVDAARNRVWLLTRDGVSVYDKAAPDRVTRVPLPNWLWIGEPYGCLPALALGPKGEAVITSNVLPTLWRVDPRTFAVTEHALALDADPDKEVGFTGLTWSAKHGAYYAVSAFHGSVWRIDTLLTRAQKIAQSAPAGKACGRAPRPPVLPGRALVPLAGFLFALLIRLMIPSRVEEDPT
ncbi:MAG: hypothetical protein WBM28_16595 [Burkholderiales bacterium]